MHKFLYIELSVLVLYTQCTTFRRLPVLAPPSIWGIGVSGDLQLPRQLAILGWNLKFGLEA